jgi:hypothetical protein
LAELIEPMQRLAGLLAARGQQRLCRRIASLVEGLGAAGW